MAEVSFNNFEYINQAYDIIREHIASLTQEQREAYANDLKRVNKDKKHIYALRILTQLLDKKQEHNKRLIDTLRASIYPMDYARDQDEYYTNRLDFVEAYKILEFYIQELEGG